MRKNTLPAFHRCQQSAIMTSILYDLDSKKQIRYIADLVFHLCNISPSKLYTDLCNSVAAALDQLPVVGNHENGSAVPRFAFQPFCDQAHILPVKAAGGLIKKRWSSPPARRLVPWAFPARKRSLARAFTTAPPVTARPIEARPWRWWAAAIPPQRTPSPCPASQKKSTSSTAATAYGPPRYTMHR